MALITAPNKDPLRFLLWRHRPFKQVLNLLTDGETASNPRFPVRKIHANPGIAADRVTQGTGWWEVGMPVVAKRGFA